MKILFFVFVFVVLVVVFKCIFVLGGIGFFGLVIVVVVQVCGYMLIFFNCGKMWFGLFFDFEKCQGDCDFFKGEGLKLLEIGEWDVVIDDFGYYLCMVGVLVWLLVLWVK